MLYKILDHAKTSFDGTWRLPKGKTPGKPMPKLRGDLRYDKHGYHVVKRQDVHFMIGEHVYECEIGPEFLEFGMHVITREARLLRRLSWSDSKARLLACDVTEQIIRTLPPKKRSRLWWPLLRAQRKLALGLISARRAEIVRDEQYAQEGYLHNPSDFVYRADPDDTPTRRIVFMLDKLTNPEYSGTGALVAIRGFGFYHDSDEALWATKRLFKYLEDKIDLKKLKKRYA